MKKLLIPLFLALSIALNAQVAERTFNLGDAPYSLSPSDLSKTIADKVVAGQDTVKFNTAWRVLKGPLYKLTYLQWRKVNYFSICFVDAAWQGEDGSRIAKPFLNTYNYINIPSGQYLSNIQLTVPRGGMSGKSSFGYYVGNGQQFEGSVATEITMNDAAWISTNPDGERILFTTPNWGLETGDMGYNESFLIQGIRLTGPDKKDGIVRIGLGLFRSGETSKVDQVFSSYFSYGFVARGAVPLTMITCSAFHNSLAGFAGRGTAGTTINLLTFSGDDNGTGDPKGALVALVPGYGNPSGGVMHITLAKDEAHATGQPVLYAEGQFAVVVDLSNASGTITGGNAIFIVDGRIGAPQNYGMQNSMLKVTGMAFGFENALVDLVARKRYPVPYGFSNMVPSSFDFTYYTRGEKFSSGIADQMPALPFGCALPLGDIPINPNTGALTAQWDYAKCLPVRNGGVVIPPVPCAWTQGPWTPWSACVNGQQSRTRTVTSSGDCTGIPAPPTVDYQSCTVPCTITYTVKAKCPDGSWSKRTAKITGPCTAPADSLSRPCKVVPPPQVRIIKGINCANAEKFVDAPEFQTSVNALGVKLMRFPGGTVSSTYHNADLSKMVALAKASNVKVLWVANLYSGTTAEMIAALDAFTAAGIEVVGVELGNEYYLNKWQDVFPDAASYIAKCKTFITALKAKYPNIPTGIVATPSANMKDPDSKGTPSKRLTDWNATVLNSGIADAVIIHAYTNEAESADFFGYALDHFTYVSTVTKKPVWVTEWNMLGSEQSAAQCAYIGNFLAMMDTTPCIQFACLHNLAAAGLNNNAVGVTTGRKGKASVTPMGVQLGKE